MSPLPPEELAAMQERSEDGLFRVKFNMPTYEVFGGKGFCKSFYRSIAPSGVPLSGVVFRMKRSETDRDFIKLYVRGRISEKMKYNVRYQKNGEESSTVFESNALDESMLRKEFSERFKGAEVISMEEAF